jgi:predicted nuclease of predicted toxin-antitoxin system
LPLKAKIDEDLPISIAQMFRDAGHDAATVGEQGFSGYADDRVWDEIQKEGRIILTADIGVADVRRHPPRDSCQHCFVSAQ